MELDALSVELDGPDLEVYANGGDERGGPCVIAEPQEETRLPDACRPARSAHARTHARRRGGAPESPMSSSYLERSVFRAANMWRERGGSL